MEQTKGLNTSGVPEAAKAKGASDDCLAGLLRDQGWAGKDIYGAFRRYYEGLTGLPVPVRAGDVGEAARDAFLYLLTFSTLATWTTALGSLMFTFIDRWFPDAVTRQPFLSTRHTIANEMACVIVAFPIFLFVMRFILRGSGEASRQARIGCPPAADLHRVVNRCGRRNRRSDDVPHFS